MLSQQTLSGTHPMNSCCGYSTADPLLTDRKIYRVLGVQDSEQGMVQDCVFFKRKLENKSTKMPNIILE